MKEAHTVLANNASLLSSLCLHNIKKGDVKVRHPTIKRKEESTNMMKKIASCDS